jgi:hypothetical protein
MHRRLRFFAASLSIASLASLTACGARVEPLDPYLEEADAGGDTNVPGDTNGGDTTYETGDYDSGYYDSGYYDSGYYDSGYYDSGYYDSGYYDSGYYDSGYFDSGYFDSGFYDTGYYDSGYFDSGFYDTGYFDSGFYDTGVDAFDTGLDAPPDSDGGLSNAICGGFESSACNGGTQACCSKAGLSYSTLGCDDAIKSWCGNQVNAVNGGAATYDGSQLAACQTRWQQFSNICAVSAITYLKYYVPCSQLFNGKTAPGGTCTLDSDCYAPPNTVAGCDTASGVCRAYAVVGWGQRCSFTGANLNYCDTGLYCDTTTYVCRTAKPSGAPCANAYDLSCGMGNVCKSGRCAPGAPVGTTCTNDLQCASWSCQGNACTDPNVNISSWGLCGG